MFWFVEVITNYEWTHKNAFPVSVITVFDRGLLMNICTAASPEIRQVPVRLSNYQAGNPLCHRQNHLAVFLCARPSRRPGFDTSILPICKDSLGWMFNKLDMNYDLLLDPTELSAIYLDKQELCLKPLFNSCDSFKDGKLSNNEWCYCFQKPDGKKKKKTQGGVSSNIWENERRANRSPRDFISWSDFHLLVMLFLCEMRARILFFPK